MSLTVQTEQLKQWSVEPTKEIDIDFSPNNPILLKVISNEQKHYIQTIEGLGIWYSDLDIISKERLFFAQKMNIPQVPVQIECDITLTEEARERNINSPHYVHSPIIYHPEILSRFIRLFMNNPLRGAEIGVLGGHCGSILLRDFPNLFLYGVDMWRSYPEYGQDLANLIKPEEWPEKEKLAYENYNSTGHGRFQMFKCWSTEPVVQNLDFIFIDANHETEFVKNDIKYWYNLVKKGGLIAGHDYWWPDDKHPTVLPGVKQALKELNIYPCVYVTDYWVWGFVKP